MCKKTENSALGELLDSIKYMIESKKGKYSLDTYLDIIGEFTDKLILEAENKEKLTYKGGECHVSPDQESGAFNFLVTLYFHDQDGKQIIKEAKRSLAMSKFTSETVTEIGDEKNYEISRPEAGR